MKVSERLGNWMNMEVISENKPDLFRSFAVVPYATMEEHCGCWIFLAIDF